jgi:hypothetical protein
MLCGGRLVGSHLVGLSGGRLGGSIGGLICSHLVGGGILLAGGRLGGAVWLVDLLVEAESSRVISLLAYSSVGHRFHGGDTRESIKGKSSFSLTSLPGLE